MRLGSVARAPLFLRVFLLMLICVGVVQLMNLALLIAVQSPAARLSTVGEVADALQRGADHTGAFDVKRTDTVQTFKWTPRAERLGLALATAMQVDPGRVEVHFPTPFLQRELVYNRAGIPAPVAPASADAARTAVLTGDFVASLRHPDGTWTVVRSGGFEPWRWFVLLWLILSAAAVAPFAWTLARRLTKPIATFAEAAERLGRDPRAAPIPLEGPMEIAEAASAFNRMQARLNRYVDDRATVVGAVAHDLRTPLMRLGLRLEGAPEDLRTACEGDIRDMEAMVSATLSYVRDTNTLLERRPLDLRSLAETVIDDLSDRGAAVSLAPGEPVVIVGNSAALKAMLANLVGNAVKYAAGGEVSIVADPDQVRVEVRDEGPGMPPEDIERAFEPFFRGERSRNRDTGGIGLGLPSARAVARAHGGDLTLKSREPRGLSAIVTLPL
ncbi:MAG: HAMP domain-containing histidine kinase [Sphingomonas sp.]|uniref:sensor histidine kinase n=1 Tax=Sphingomonas sp. TaxID=28214 RepID=UPI0025CE4976|nr:HAMP domain-containing sensor histidine kinase [Sphingomonas sp.]MBX3563681.1 HAMP domain-containing histidine kinase [Sphingomonas sp.]